MKVVVFTPTCRPGGLDVAIASLIRQRRADLIWIVADELYAQRAHFYDPMELTPRDDGPGIYPVAPCATYAFDTAPLHRDGNPFTLAAAYRKAMNMARELDADLFISMQDYLWVPDDGVDRFIRLAAERPRSLLTGLCSLSSDPGADQIADPDGLYTIFAAPYTRKPRRIGWRDCRLEMVSSPQQRIHPSAWETNWAAIPRELLHHPDLDFDLAYDRGHAYENQAYALKAYALGFDAWIDCENEAIGLPHKAYFPEQEERFEESNNRFWHDRRLAEQGYVEL